MFCAIHARTAEFMFTTPDAMEWKLFMARLQAGGGPTGGFQIFYQRVHRRMRAVMAQIVSRLLGLPAHHEETLIRVIALNGQLTVFSVVRRSALTALNWDAVDAPRLALLQRIIREQTEAVLRSLIVAREARKGAPARAVREPIASRDARRDGHSARSTTIDSPVV